MSNFAIMARCGLDTGNISKDAAKLEGAVTGAAKRAQAASSRLAAHTAKLHTQAAAEMEKAYKEAYAKVERGSAVTWANMDKHVQAATRAQLAFRKVVGQGGSAADAHGAGGHGHGGGIGNTRAIGDILDNLTGTSGWAMKANIAAHFTRLLPPLAIGMMLKKGLTDQINLAGENDKMEGLLGRSVTPFMDRFKPSDFKEGTQTGLAEAHSTEGLHARNAALAEQSKKLGEGRTFFGSAVGAMGMGILGSMPGGSIVNAAITKHSQNQTERSHQLQQEADEKILKNDATLAGRLRDQVAAREILLNKSQRAGEYAQQDVELAEKLAKIQDAASKGEDGSAPKMGVAEAAEARKAALAEHGEQRIATDRKLDAAKIEIELQEGLNQLRTEGDEEGIKAAELKLKAAKAQADLARISEDKEKDAGAVHAAETELILAQKAHGLKSESYATEMQLAALRGSADERHLAFLIAEQRLLQSQRDNKDHPPTPAEKKEIAKKLALNQQAQADNAFAIGNRGFDLANTIVDAGTGRGKAAQMEAARQKYNNEQSRLTYFKSSDQTKNDGEAIGKQEVVVKNLRNAYLDMQDAQEKTLRETDAQNEVLQAELAHRATLAAQLRIEAHYHELIKEAQKNEDVALEKKLEKQKALTLETLAQAKAEALKHQTQLSLETLATKGSGKTQADARRALDYEARAKNAAARGDTEGAQKWQKKANDIKDHIEALNDAEKTPDRGDPKAKVALDPDLSRRAHGDDTIANRAVNPYRKPALPGQGREYQPTDFDKELKPHLDEEMKPILGPRMLPHLAERMKPSIMTQRLFDAANGIKEAPPASSHSPGSDSVGNQQLQELKGINTKLDTLRAAK